MAQADVLNIVQELTVGQADPVLALDFYAEDVYDLAAALWLTNVQTFAPVEGVLEQAFATTIQVLLGVIYDNTQLDMLPLRDVESIDYWWRSRSGFPQAVIAENEPQKVFAWFPTPDVSAPAVGGADPTGADYQPNQALLIFSETRVNVQPYLELPLALRILQQEYGRESDHTDKNVMALAGTLADLMLEMLK